MALQRDTVAIPVARGINVNTPARVVDPQELLEAQNVRFTSAVGARKRRGHLGQKIRGAKTIPVDWIPPTFARPTFVTPFYTGDRSIDSDWLFGHGYVAAASAATPATALQTSDYPDGPALGIASRDNETLVWDGHRLLSRTTLDLPGGQFAEFPAVMPSLRSEPFAKANIAQSKPDVADNGTIRIAVWISAARAYYSVFDSETGALITGPSALAPLSPALAVRALPVGDWIQMFVAMDDSDSLELYSIHSTAPTAVSHHSYGDCNGYFDVWKFSESAFVVAQSRGSEIMVRVANADATLVPSQNFVADISGFYTVGTGIRSVAVCVHPTTNRIGLVWRTDTQVLARCYLADGTTQGDIKLLGTITSATRGVAIAPKYLLDSDSEEAFNTYWDDWSGFTGFATLNIGRWTRTDGVVYSASRFHLLVGSQGFRVGDRTYIWAARNSTYQSSWVLLDETLKPVGRAEYISANTPAGTDAAYTPFSVNWSGSAPEKDRCVYHCALSTRVRVPVEPTTVGVNPPAVYSEPYIKFARLDFLPRLHWAQAGRTTYFTGAQLWAYDGAELTEANFLLAPEGTTVFSTANTPGDLTAEGTYTYRVDLCYRNAQNEEIRSASFYTDALTLPADETAAILTIPTVLTRRENSYFLIFRNENVGTVWYLCNSRDPSSALYLRNDQSVREVTFTDSTVSDAELISREQHPNQSFNYLDPFAAPAAEVIAAGRDRVWLAGGEIAAGQVYPSRLFEPGEVPAFHALLAVQVDRSIEPITAIGFVGELTVFSRRTQNYILDGEGPDNISQGLWNTPREPKEPTNIGAVSQESVAKIPGGLIFQTPAGIRLFTGDSLVPIGAPVDSLAKTLNITSAVVVGQDEEVRFYAWDGTTLVYNYAHNTWSTWAISAAGAVLDLTTNLAVLATPTGSLWREVEDTWTDDGATYKQRIRFAWLRAGGLLDFQQIRRIGACGEGSAHDIHVDVYYNEREFAEESFDWTVPDPASQNQDTFGAGDFGDGNFGDTDGVAGISFLDLAWPWRRRLFRRKCSVISVAIDDNYTNGEGFTLTALALELAKKPGLDRTPWRGGTYNNTGSNGSSETGN